MTKQTKQNGQSHIFYFYSNSLARDRDECLEYLDELLGAYGWIDAARWMCASKWTDSPIQKGVSTSMDSSIWTEASFH